MSQDTIPALPLPAQPSTKHSTTTCAASTQATAGDGRVPDDLPVIPQSQVEEHRSPESLWVVHGGLVYDVTEFAKDHPGGFDAIYQYAAQDLQGPMSDPDEHVHSDTAYDILEDCLIGKLAITAAAAAPTTSRDVRRDKKFLDFSQPIIWQLLTSGYSKAYYLEQVHIPRHLSFTARFFKYDALEMLTLTPWQVVPAVWGPVVAYSAWAALREGLAATFVGAGILTGLAAWSVLEYVFHRFLFHMEWLLPNHRVALTTHFLLHGVHHVIPMDRYRLVMPPVLFFLIHLFPRLLIFSLVPASAAYALYAGAILGYILYDLTHYFCHHAQPRSGYLHSVKVYHMAHHYKDANRGFGVSSKVWDLVFGTTLNVLKKKEGIRWA